MKHFAACALLLAVAPRLTATLVNVWDVQAIENAPALVVATVESVTPKELVPSDRVRLNIQQRYWEVELHILRAFPREVVGGGARIAVRYVAPVPAGGGFGMGVNVWPDFAKGVTFLVALAPDANGPWRLVADRGVNLTVPAMEQSPRSAEEPATGRAFILSELANALANGNPAKRGEAAVYLRSTGNWPVGFRQSLEQAVGTDDDHWLEVAFTVLAHMGTPHAHLDRLMANENLSSAADRETAWLLAKGARRDFPNRLILCTLRHMPEYDWGATNILLEVKDSPLVMHELTASLKRDPAGSIYAAYTLVRNGQQTFLPDALDAAVTLVNAPGAVPVNSLRGATWLLRDYGSNAQFETIVTSLRRLKTQNGSRYQELFGAVDDRFTKRVVRADAVLIDDRRFGYGPNLRYCDVAAASVQKISGVDFGFNQDTTLIQRDRAVAATAAWLKSHPDGQ